MAQTAENSRAAGPETPVFVHLRVHSAYSLLEGALPFGRIIDIALADGQPAIGIADTNNLFGALEFSVKAAAAGVQPILGCQLDIDMEDAGIAPGGPAPRGRPAKLPSVVLIAMNDAGYARLIDLVSRAYLDRETMETAHLGASWLDAGTGGLICLTGGRRGPVDRALADGRTGMACARADRLHALFGGRLYVELQRHADRDGPDGGGRGHERRLLKLAYDRGLPLVATNEAFFAASDDFDAHDALMAVAQNAVVSDDSRARLTPDHYLKSRAAMGDLFADLPEALENTVEIARRCSLLLRPRAPILPRFTGARSADAPSDGEEADRAEAAELRRQAKEGLEARLAAVGPADGFAPGDYHGRLEAELAIVERMRYPGYFLIVADFIKWAKARGIPVGPGRGSGAGSLVAYALTITDVDPLRFSLLFERFLNPERVSMPDFDIDFCQDRRDEVTRYVQKKYGFLQVAQIITFGTLQARAALRDIGRVLQIPYAQVDRICKLVPGGSVNPTPLHRAIEEEPRLREAADKEPAIRRLLDIARKIEGLCRHASTHAAGIVIADRPLSQLVPLYRDPRSDMPVTQFSMKWAEEAGLVKFDFLGLKTLTVLKTVADHLGERGVRIDLDTLPLDDAPTFAMLSRGETVGVFQVESAGMRKALTGMRPDRIEDIIALVALYRPGPMENIPVYIARKHGEEEIVSIHPKIDHLLEETQGVIVYQEQVMQIAQVLAGYSLGEADLLRRAMGKKIKKEMDSQRSRFVSGAIESGVGKRQADRIFELLARFADYGFNKSHAAAYGVVAYRTAYLKANYPVEFLAGSMTADMSNTDRLNDFRQEAARLGIAVAPPSVQTSLRFFKPGDERIHYALAAIKGVGEAAAEHIAEARGGRSFGSLEEFFERIDARIVNRRVLEHLICAGALDCFGHERAQLFCAVDQLVGLAQRTSEDRRSGQRDIFAAAPPPLQLAHASPWTETEKLHREYEALGFHLSAHPLDAHGPALRKMEVQTFAAFSDAVHQGAVAGRLAGTVTAMRERKTSVGGRMGVVALSDTSGQYEAIVFAEALARYRDLLKPGKTVVVTVDAEDRPEGAGLRIQTVRSLDTEEAGTLRALRVFLCESAPLADIEALLDSLPGGGEGRVSLVVVEERSRKQIEVELPRRYPVSPQVAAALKATGGIVDVELVRENDRWPT